MGGSLLGGGEDHGGAVNVIGTEHPDGALADGVVGHHGEEGGINAQIRQGQGDIGLRTAVGSLELVGHADLLVVGGSQAQHDLTDGDKFVAALIAQQGIMMFHG